MARSKRFPAYFRCSGAHPAFAKANASRRIRHAVRQHLHVMQDEFDYVDPQDKIRGNAGSRSGDWGGYLYGDGRTRPRSNHREYQPFFFYATPEQIEKNKGWRDKWIARLSRK